jgi:peroxiredoxin Q/BCP
MNIALLATAALAAAVCAPAMASQAHAPQQMPKVGSKAPEFALKGDDGKTYSLAAQRGKWVVLAFYPADMTPGCTLEARSLRDNMAAIRATHAEVFGISVQDVASHKRFCGAEKLNYRLLADDKRQVAAMYGVLPNPNGNAKRTTFYIDPHGIIRRIDTSVNVTTHGKDVLAALKELMASSQS